MKIVIGLILFALVSCAPTQKLSYAETVQRGADKFVGKHVSELIYFIGPPAARINDPDVGLIYRYEEITESNKTYVVNSPGGVTTMGSPRAYKDMISFFISQDTVRHALYERTYDVY